MKRNFVLILISAVTLFISTRPAFGDPTEDVIKARKSIADLGYLFSPESFIKAISGGDEVAFDLFLKAKVNVNEARNVLFLYKDCEPSGLLKTSVTPLFVAAELGNEPFVDRLIKAHAEVNALSDRCSSKGLTPLMIAAYKGKVAVLKTLLENGADPNLLDAGGSSALYFSLTDSDTQMAELLLKKKADVNASAGNNPALLKAVVTLKNLKLTEFLLGHGAQIDIQDRYGNTALSSAVSNGTKEMIQLLLKSKAGVKNSANNPNYAFQLLDTAVTHRHDDADEVVKWLVKQGIDLDAKDRRGIPVLCSLVRDQNVRGVEILFKHGAKPNIKSDEGYTALDYANDLRNYQIQELLKKAGGKATRKTD